jgi:2Fe-2S ferredoxin
MPKVIFIEHTGTQHVVDATSGRSVMQAALDNGTPGILAECGGCVTCATCHSYIDDAWTSKMPVKTAEEEMMLEGALDLRSNSRLTCQIMVNDKLDGLIVHLPARQS